MAKSKTTDTGSRAEQLAQNEGQSLDAQLSELSAEISRTEGKISRAAAIIKAAHDKILKAKAAYDERFLKSDTAGMSAAQFKIRRANEEQAAAVETLASLVDPLDDLGRRQAELWQAALIDLGARKEAAEAARRTWASASLRLDQVGFASGKLSSLRKDLLKFVPQPTAPAAPAEPERKATNTKPACPRCLRPDDVAPAGPGRWTCVRAYHGPLAFNANGRIVEPSSRPK